MVYVQIMTVMGDCHVHCREPAMIGRIIYESLKLECPVLWTGMKSFPAGGRE